MVSLVGLYAATLSAAPLTVENELQQGRQQFESGQYQQAIERYEELLNHYRLKTREQIIETHRMLGAAYFHQQNPQMAADHFNSLLNFDRQGQLDSAYFSPKVVDFFDSLHQQRKTGWQTNERKPTIAPPLPLNKATAQHDPSMPPSTLQANDFLDARPDDYLLYRFIPFGVGQYKNNQPVKGNWFLGLQALTGATAIASWFLFTGEQESHGGFADPGAAEAYQNLFAVSLVSFSTLMVTGIIDAVYVHQKKENL